MDPNGIEPFPALPGAEVSQETRRRKGHVPRFCEATREDVGLVALMAGGDAGAFALLYDRHCRAAYFVAHGITRERQAAEDVLQNAFLRVWRAAGSYQAHKGTVKTWILAIVQNQAIDELRASVARRRVRDRFEATAPGWQPSEAFVERRDPRHAGLREALDALPPEQLEVVRLAYFSDHTHFEIADLLDLPLGTVKSRMRLAFKKIRAHFGARGAMDLSA